jgi:hypothetical protein
MGKQESDMLSNMLAVQILTLQYECEALENLIKVHPEGAWLVERQAIVLQVLDKLKAFRHRVENSDVPG